LIDFICILTEKIKITFRKNNIQVWINFKKTIPLKSLIYIFFFAFTFTACTPIDQINNEPQVDLTVRTNSDTSKHIIENHITQNEIIPDDSVIVFNDSLFVDLNPDLVEISEDDFEYFKYNYKGTCVMEPGGFIRGSGLSFTNNCDEICEAYLVEKETGRRLYLPSGYDAGITDILISSTCDQLIVCSSFDGPDYVNYYRHRSELFVFNIALGNGINGITPAYKHYATDWSISDMIWVSDKAIALKTYEDDSYGDNSHLRYKYYKLNLIPNLSSDKIQESDQH
jgi:hypothetical protein